MARSARPRGLLFDLDGTLLTGKRWDPAEGAARLLARSRNPQATSPDIVRMRMAELQKGMRVRRDEARIELTMQTRLKLVFERLGVTFDLPPAELEWEMWRESLWFMPEPGAVDAMVEVLHREIPAGLVSNTPFTGETVARELKIQGLDEAIRLVVTSADYGVRKPDPLIFLAAAGRLGLEPARVWHVGESAAIDVAGAQGAGLKAVWYNPARKAPPPRLVPDAEISAWSEFPALVERGL
jgi:putative hydrolase of the HAD superfamily